MNLYQFIQLDEMEQAELFGYRVFLITRIIWITIIVDASILQFAKH